MNSHEIRKELLQGFLAGSHFANLKTPFANDPRQPLAQRDRLSRCNCDFVPLRVDSDGVNRRDFT